MKRRDALKHIGLTAGFVVATPTLISLLQGCSSNSETWTPIFLTQDQGTVLKNLVDVILPKTDTPSASEVNVPEFIDKYINDILDIEDQDKFKVSFDELIAVLKTDYNDNLNKITEEDYKDLLDKHLIINQPANSESVSKLLNNFKWMTINAYKISETVGETILAYDPVPGIPERSCMTIEEATGGVAWSLR